MTQYEAEEGRMVEKQANKEKQKDEGSHGKAVVNVSMRE